VTVVAFSASVRQPGKSGANAFNEYRGVKRQRWDGSGDGNDSCSAKFGRTKVNIVNNCLQVLFENFVK